MNTGLRQRAEAIWEANDHPGAGDREHLERGVCEGTAVLGSNASSIPFRRRRRAHGSEKGKRTAARRAEVGNLGRFFTKEETAGVASLEAECRSIALA